MSQLLRSRCIGQRMALKNLNMVIIVPNAETFVNILSVLKIVKIFIHLKQNPILIKSVSDSI